jgi:hypothetical protein
MRGPVHYCSAFSWFSSVPSDFQSRSRLHRSESLPSLHWSQLSSSHPTLYHVTLIFLPTQQSPWFLRVSCFIACLYLHRVTTTLSCSTYTDVFVPFLAGKSCIYTLRPAYTSFLKCINIVAWKWLVMPRKFCSGQGLNEVLAASSVLLRIFNFGWSIVSRFI